jgi:thiamine pyrophosphokinase
MKRVWIYTGGSLGDWALHLPHDEDFLIGADRGAAFLIHHGKTPDLILGDFDSITDKERTTLFSSGIPVEEFDPVMKDYSDTELAFLRAAQLKPDEIVIVGALGTRFDHSLANVHLLRKALELEIPCRIIDEHNEIQLIDRCIEISNSEQRYVSLLPLTLRVTGVTLEGFQYPLHDAMLEIGQSLAVSNILQEPVGLITISSGLLLVIQSRD